MALYNHAGYLRQSQHGNFDSTHQPGSRVPDSGVYRCEGCGREISHNENTVLPPQNHHQHTSAQGSIRWRLIVAAETNG